MHMRCQQANLLSMKYKTISNLKNKKGCQHCIDVNRTLLTLYAPTDLYHQLQVIWRITPLTHKGLEMIFGRKKQTLIPDYLLHPNKRLKINLQIINMR